MGQTFRPAAVVSKNLVGFFAAGAFAGDLLQLLFEFLLGELAALQTIAGFDDFFDVKFENIAPAKLALGALPPCEEIRRAAGRTLAAPV